MQDGAKTEALSVLWRKIHAEEACVPLSRRKPQSGGIVASFGEEWCPCNGVGPKIAHT